MTGEGWKIWDGGAKFDARDVVEIVISGGRQYRLPAANVDWNLTGAPTDVAFYRIVSKHVPSGATTAPGILHKAASIMEERGKQYDKPGGERSMGQAVSAFNIIAGRDLQESEGWLLLQVLKDVRDRQRKEAHVDSLEDCVAYSALKAEARMAGK
jgi:hypothetical protein